MKVGDIVKFKDLGETIFAKVERIKRQKDICFGKMETRIDMITPDGYQYTRFNPRWNVRKATLYELLFEALKTNLVWVWQNEDEISVSQKLKEKEQVLFT